MEFLVITSRGRKRLIVPKGWPIAGKHDARAAAIEAKEEAGVKGRVDTEPFGTFDYSKDIGDIAVSVSAAVFPLRVEKLKQAYKERGERKRRWMRAEEAAEKLDDIGLRQLVRRYAARLERPE